MIFRRNAAGEATQLIGVATDITEIKKSHENLKELNNILLGKNVELEQMNAELASFSYVASHDLQEPLRKIKTFAALITEREVSLSDSTKEYFNRIVAAAMRMQNLIEALLSYSRTNTSENTFEKTDLNKILEDVKNDLSELIVEKRAVIESCKLPRLKVVPVQFHQLFLNIINNAIKYSKPNETPRVKICAQPIDGESISAQRMRSEIKYWRISFEDNGIGFDPQYQNRIFELFQRLHGKSEYPGTGIGLAICKKIVQNHNGIITARGEPGKGAIFEAYIPA
jgi:light-regulated signal transduction histidine kinase (bacteriophytochrome)